MSAGKYSSRIKAPCHIFIRRVRRLGVMVFKLLGSDADAENQQEFNPGLSI